MDGSDFNVVPSSDSMMNYIVAGRSAKRSYCYCLLFNMEVVAIFVAFLAILSLPGKPEFSQPPTAKLNQNSNFFFNPSQTTSKPSLWGRSFRKGPTSL